MLAWRMQLFFCMNNFKIKKNKDEGTWEKVYTNGSKGYGLIIPSPFRPKKYALFVSGQLTIDGLTLIEAKKRLKAF